MLTDFVLIMVVGNDKSMALPIFVRVTTVQEAHRVVDAHAPDDY